jgi:hypothetical protein
VRWFPLIYDNAIAIVDAETGTVAGQVKTGGVAPFGSVISRDGAVAWVSNGGPVAEGRRPDPSAGLDPKADRVVVDARGIASTGTVARVDLDAQKVTHSIDVGLHPTAVAWDEPRQRLYVANANKATRSPSSTTAEPRVAATIPLQPFGLDLKGIAPSALCVSADGRRLYAALGGLNAVAVVDVQTRSVRGFISPRRGIRITSRSAATARRSRSPRCSAWDRAGSRPRRGATCTRIAARSATMPVPDDSTAGELHDGGCREQLHRHGAGAARARSRGRHDSARGSQEGRRSLARRSHRLHRQGKPDLRQLFGDLPRGNGIHRS